MPNAASRSASGRTRAERLEARVTAEQKSLIERAAALQGRTVTDFVLTRCRMPPGARSRNHQLGTLGPRQRGLRGCAAEPQAAQRPSPQHGPPLSRAGRRLTRGSWKRRYASSRSAQAMIGRGLRAVSSRWTDIFGLQAGQDARKNMAAPSSWCCRTVGSRATTPSPRRLCNLGSCQVRTVRKLPKYPLVPATLLGRLAVDRRQQGKGYGRFLLADALYRAARSEIASFAVIVDAKDANAAAFTSVKAFCRFRTSL